MIELYTYQQIADIFGVRITTVRNWRHAKKFEILGYRKVGRWAKQALVSEEQVKALMGKVFLPPGSHPALKKKK